MIRITGLDKLSRDLADAQRALEDLDGELGTVNFDPHDLGSIEAAIQEVERLVDERLGSYVSNPIIAPIAEGLKQHHREALLERAVAARLQDGQS